MKIGIIIYSQTGNTLSVGEKLKIELENKGHQVDLKRIQVENETERRISFIKFRENPSTEGYDLIIFGSPVHAFSLCPVMSAYLNQIQITKKIKVACFVTQFFPYAWMGGNHAIRQMKKACEKKEVDLCDFKIINWSKRIRNDQIEMLIKSFSSIV